MGRDGDGHAAWWAEARRGFVQAVLIGAVTLALVGGLWLLARDAPSARGVPAPTPVATTVKPTTRFGVASFPTAPPIEGGVGTPTADIDDEATPVS